MRRTWKARRITSATMSACQRTSACRATLDAGCDESPEVDVLVPVYDEPVAVVDQGEAELRDGRPVPLGEIRERVQKRERVLVTTLTKRMAEDLTEYYAELGVRVRYLHSDIDTLERIEIVRDLRLGRARLLRDPQAAGRARTRAGRRGGGGGGEGGGDANPSGGNGSGGNGPSGNGSGGNGGGTPSV